MGRILIGWENGAGFGHVAAIRIAARALKARGHEPILALRDLVEPWPMLKNESYPVLQGPYWSRPAPSPGGKPFSAASFADILAITGFSNPLDMAPMLRAWDGLFDLLQPDVVLAEYAPAMVLAARGRLPAVMFGTGFTMPPADLPVYPPLQPDIQPVMPQERLLAAVQETQRRRGRPVPKTLPEILACERRFPCTFPEIDPYRSTRREPTIPPLGELPPVVPLLREPRFFAYLAGDVRGLPKLVAGIAKSGLPGAIFIRRIPNSVREAIKKTSIQLFEEPVPLPNILPQVTLVIHHGGSGTTEACLTAGRPQLLVSRHLEQAMTANALRQLGVGVRPANNATEDALAEMVKTAASDSNMQDRAMATAKTIDSRGPRPGVAPIVSACEELMARAKKAVSAS